MPETSSAEISYEIIETEEPSFKPEAQQIGFTLQPVPEEVPIVPIEQPKLEFTLGAAPYYKEPKAPMKECMLNIETTGLMPFDSVICSLAAADYTAPDNVQVWSGKNEQEIVRGFIDWFDYNGFNRIIIFNAGFDFRFIIAKAMKYGIYARNFIGAEILDEMQVMLQGREEYLRTLQKPGTLNEWCSYFFGPQSEVTAEEIIYAYENDAFDIINTYNREQVNRLYLLLSLMRYVGVPDA